MSEYIQIFQHIISYLRNEKMRFERKSAFYEEGNVDSRTCQNWLANFGVSRFD